jgi:protein SCO1/2
MRRAARAPIGPALVLAGTVGLALFASLLCLRTAAAASGAEDLAFRPHPGDRLPLSTTLTDEQGRSVALGDYFNKAPVILVLDYLRCTSLCGVTLQNLVEALGRLPLEPGRDYRLVTISIDPRDKPADAAAAQTKYVDLLGRQGAASGMHFLTTPSTVAVRAIADAVGFRYRYDNWLDAYLHPAGFVIVAPDGVISRYVEGIAISPQDLIGAVADAEQDKSQGPLTRLLILCHVQGVALGRLAAPVLGAFTLANIAAGCALVAIFTLIWRRRHS